MDIRDDDEAQAVAAGLAAVAIAFICALVLSGCGGALQGGTITIPPLHPVTYNVACVVSDDTGAVIEGARCGIEDQDSDTNADGYHLFLGVPAGFRQMVASKDGYTTAGTPFTNDHDQDVAVVLKRIIQPLPPAPTRAELLNVHITFQGLVVDCQPFGPIPLFESGLPWMTPQCRANVYAAKHASDAWPGGDTHALVHLPSGPPLYDEANQPYSADRFGPLDWTAGGTHIDGRLADLIAEVIGAGFRDVLLFEGGDGTNGQPIAMNQLDLLSAALSSTPYGDLRPYVVVIPGYDGVFYGWEPSHVLIPAWVEKCRSLFPYCGIEHSTGHIPLGEGDQDWTGNGAMRGIDLLLEEFNDDAYDDSIWQIAARVLGPAYHRPAEQPSGDDPGSPFGPTAGQFILRQPTDRGPIVPCAFEFHEYTDVHSNGGAAELANTAKQRAYLKARGYTCGG
jgi:hypothetical protein